MVDAFCNVVNRQIKKINQTMAVEENEAASSSAFLNIPTIALDYKDLMAKVVCNVDVMECMVHRCESCPGYKSLEQFIVGKVEELEIEGDVYYSQWESTDRTALRKHIASLDEFIELLVCNIDNLTTHSFIARSQTNYLKQRKNEIDGSTCIIVLDFAENYRFIVQDEVQGYHWNKDQCTLHPVVIYYRDGSILKHVSLCFLSDDLQHDTSFVYELQRQSAEFIKIHLSKVNRVEYFSDGCVGQYKEFKNLLNLCHHTQDFGLHAVWSFFATSHGKYPCDGIGGIVKRKLAQASLQRPLSDQILSFRAVTDYCNKYITGIKFHIIYKAEMRAIRKKCNTDIS